MEYKLTRSNPTTAELDLSFNAEEILNAYEKAYLKAAPKVHINGFRKGKAPLSMIKKVLGDSVAEEAITILLNDSLLDLYPKLEISPYSQPKISIEKFDKNSELIAHVTIELNPVIKLADYKNLELHIYNPTVEEEDLQPHLREIQYYLSKTQAKEADEAIEEYDAFDMNITITNLEGKTIFNKDKLFFFMNRYEYNQDFEKNFLGLKVGEEKEFEFSYPKNYPVKLFADKTLKHKVKIETIYRVILPEINDDLAREYTDGQDDLNHLKEKIRNHLLKEIELDLNEHYFQELIFKISQGSEYYFPDSLIEAETKNQFELALHKNGIFDPNITFETLANYTKKSEAEVKEVYRSLAIGRLKFLYTVLQIAIQEKLTVSEKEIEEEIHIRKSHDPNLKVDNKIRDNIFLSLMTRKVESFLMENANKIVEKETSLEKIREIISA